MIYICKVGYSRIQENYLFLCCWWFSYYLQYFNSYFLYNVTLLYWFVINILRFLIFLPLSFWFFLSLFQFLWKWIDVFRQYLFHRSDVLVLLSIIQILNYVYSKIENLLLTCMLAHLVSSDWHIKIFFQKKVENMKSYFKWYPEFNFSLSAFFKFIAYIEC